MRVLIADDQKDVGSTIAALVSECEHEVVEVVGSGFEAIQAYNRLRPDVVLMDYYMPHLNGATACRNILSRHPGANVILVSGVAGAKDLGHFGAMGMLTKPVDLSKLRDLLDGSPAGRKIQGRICEAGTRATDKHGLNTDGIKAGPWSK